MEVRGKLGSSWRAAWGPGKKDLSVFAGDWWEGDGQNQVRFIKRRYRHLSSYAPKKEVQGYQCVCCFITEVGIPAEEFSL